MTHIEKSEYYEIIYPILENEEFQKRKDYKHHGNISVYEHSLAVSKMSYKIAKKMNKDYKSAAIGGLLHDFYKTPWQDIEEKQRLLKKHGFTHAKDALKNSYLYFPDLVNNKIENIIIRHMFPLNKIPPKFIESWIVSLVDKYISLEVLKKPKDLSKLIGIRRKACETNG